MNWFAVCKHGGEGLGDCQIHDVRLTEGRHRRSSARLQICSAPMHTAHKLARKSSCTFMRTGSDEHYCMGLSIAVDLDSVD